MGLDTFHYDKDILMEWIQTHTESNHQYELTEQDQQIIEDFFRYFFYTLLISTTDSRIEDFSLNLFDILPVASFIEDQINDAERDCINLSVDSFLSTFSLPYMFDNDGDTNIKTKNLLREKCIYPTTLNHWNEVIFNLIKDVQILEKNKGISDHDKLQRLEFLFQKHLKNDAFYFGIKNKQLTNNFPYNGILRDLNSPLEGFLFSDKIKQFASNIFNWKNYCSISRCHFNSDGHASSIKPWHLMFHMKRYPSIFEKIKQECEQDTRQFNNPTLPSREIFDSLRSRNIL